MDKKNLTLLGQSENQNALSKLEIDHVFYDLCTFAVQS